MHFLFNFLLFWALYHFLFIMFILIFKYFILFWKYNEIKSNQTTSNWKHQHSSHRNTHHCPSVSIKTLKFHYLYIRFLNQNHTILQKCLHPRNKKNCNSQRTENNQICLYLNDNNVQLKMDSENLHGDSPKKYFTCTSVVASPHLDNCL